MERKSIGTFIAALRRANGMTQKQLAEKLQVSDKAVSRWERDESLPDLTLLPLIADVFDITVDELLRGERRGQDAFVQQRSSDPERLKKQTRRVMHAACQRAQGRMMIALGCAFGGVVAAMVCNFAVLRAVPGLVVGLLLWVAGAAMLWAFTASAWRQEKEEYDAAVLHDYRARLAAQAKRIALAMLAMLALILPLATALSGVQAGYVDVWVKPQAWLIRCAAVGAMLSLLGCIGLYIANRRLAAAGYYPQARNRRHGWVAMALAAAMAITLLIGSAASSGMLGDRYAYWQSFDDFEQFQAWCAQQAENADETGNVYYAISSAGEVGQEDWQDVFMMPVYDPRVGNGAEALLGEINTYGLSGWTVHHSTLSPDTLTFRGITKQMQQRQNNARQGQKSLMWTLLCIEPVLALGAWMLLSADKTKNTAKNG